jgi:SAM-dependent MidA family methyltransferase
MGMPEQVKFIELGPGRGTMMADALRAVRILPAFHDAISVHLVEASPTLRDKQRDKLADAAYVEWYDRIEDVPEGPAIILANEFFDALPIHQAVRKETGWHERTIGIDDGILAYGTAEKPMPRFEVLLPPLVRAAPVGAIFEWRPDNEIITLARRVRDQGGAALIIDYGHVRSDAGDTFQGIARHGFANPLRRAGEADVTAHVDFEALARAAQDIGARTHGPVEQGAFLTRLGIETRAQTLMKNASEEGAQAIAAALQRLTGSGKENMGSLFKVLGISHPSIETLAALSDSDPANGAQRP